MDIRAYILKKTVAVALSAAAVFSNQSKEAAIRVLLMTDGYGSYFHETADYEINETRDGFVIPSIHRDCGVPEYKGTVEVVQTEKGFLFINQLSVEEYVKAVVPSEMPSGYEMEALKAQAICARTYAYYQMQEGKLSEFGADVDDSVSFQVYKNQSQTEKTDAAVDATRGMVMTYEGKPIEAFFFSTSSGATSTDEVWESESAPCLKSIVTPYDQDMPWYRWQVFFPKEKMESLLVDAGYDIGEIKEIQILKKSQGGAAVVCSFVGTKDTVDISNEYQIRSILSPRDLIIYRQDGSEVTDFRLLPSAYFQVKAVLADGILTGFSIQGGGYGHGVGMSQNGANEMAKQGYTFEEILEYYYQDYNLEIIDK